MQEAVPGKPIISARQLRVRYGDREILHGLDFDIPHGETVVILGGSGIRQEHTPANDRGS